MDTPSPISNLPEFSVSEISGAIKRLLEGSFGRVRVRGEITEFKRYPSGHLYFSLKDEGGKISGVCWRGTVSRLGLVPENGLEVIATGKISSYGERSSYQLIVERMEYAGEGALLARIERLRLRLAAEGLFDADRKRALPGLPQVVGIVTSSQGAVLHDIRTTVARRFPRRLLVWPVPVQGEGAAARIAAAIAGPARPNAISRSARSSSIPAGPTVSATRPVAIRRMFGAKGIYHAGRIVALDLRAEVMLKADALSAPAFAAAGATQWRYEGKGGKPVAMPYWTVPVDAFDDPDEMARWVRLAYEAALRAAD